MERSVAGSEAIHDRGEPEGLVVAVGDLHQCGLPVRLHVLRPGNGALQMVYQQGDPAHA
jgi:hypothetical protein